MSNWCGLTLFCFGSVAPAKHKGNEMSNKWSEMSRKERRIAVAKDALKWIDAGLFRLGDTGYAKLRKPKNCNLDDFITQKLAKSQARNCEACARGVLMLTKLGEYNGVRWSEATSNGLVTQSCTSRALSDCFDSGTLRDIEDFYEIDGHPFYDDDEFYDEDEDEYDNKKRDLLRIIFQNIIDNDGTFKPSVIYDIVEV